MHFGATFAREAKKTSTVRTFELQLISQTDFSCRALHSCTAVIYALAKMEQRWRIQNKKRKVIELLKTF
jgi:hypothetical protein